MWPEEESHISIVQIQRVVEKDVKEEGITSMRGKKRKIHIFNTVLIVNDKLNVKEFCEIGFV